MGKLTAALKTAIEDAPLYALATASSGAVPNVVPIKFVFIENDNELWLVDNFMGKTLQNLQQNPVAALNILLPDQEVSFQIKGTTTIESAGEKYQKMRDSVLAVKPDAPAKSLITMTITEIFDCWPGSTIGQRLDQ
jgi:predicted pyridoxine 5'-phosphate oxidase superfamily flavin-nucleotide-binding protein